MFGQPAQTQPTSSVFGQPQTTQSAPTMAGSSMFGGLAPAATTAPAQGGMFGKPTTAAQPNTTSILGGSVLGGANNNQTTNATAPNNPAPTVPPTGAYFDSLLAKSKRQQPDGDDAMLEDLPALQLGLGDLRQRLKKLGSRKVDGERAGRNTHYLLAASGIEPGSAVRDLGSLGFQQSRFDRTTHAGAQGELDVDTYLSNLQNKTTLSMIADGLERSARDFDAFLEDNVTEEWEAQRRRIYDHFGITPRQTSGVNDGRESGGFGGKSRRKAPSSPGKSAARGSVFARSALGKSVIGTPSRIGPHRSQFSDVAAANGDGNGGALVDERVLRDKQLKLADKIHNLNDARQQGLPYPILKELADVAGKSGDRHAEPLADAYNAMAEMVGESPDADSDATAHERQYAAAYLDPNPNSQHVVAVKKRILAGSNKFLERKFMDSVEQQIAKNPIQSQLGGRPDVLSKIKAYVRLLNQNKHLAPEVSALQSIKSGDDQEFVWAIIFYLLRSGHVTEAAQYVNDNQNYFRAIDRSFPGFMNSYATDEDRRLKRQLQDRCNTEYSQRIRNAPDNAVDPFRAACYKIIGRCDLTNRSFEGFNADVNDWIWLQFNLAREGDRSVEIAGEMFGLKEVQETIKEVGQKYFPKNNVDDANGNFGMFFFMQILCGDFEKAVAYLYNFVYVDAVHFAIALEFYGLLRPSGEVTSDLLTKTTRGQPEIAFAMMLGYYTRDFRAANVAAAVDYIVLMYLNHDDPNEAKAKVQAQICYEALRELVLETREFSKLIGDIRPDGQRIPGIIETRGSLLDLKKGGDVVTNITLQAARFANDNGRTTDAVLLYHLAEEYDTVVNILSRAVSEAISLAVGGEQMRLDPIKPRAEGIEAQQGSSLSLATIDNPIELAQTMMQMYESKREFRENIQEINRAACSVLLQMAEIKDLVASGQWMAGLDVSDLTHTIRGACLQDTNTTSHSTAHHQHRDLTTDCQWRSDYDPRLCGQI